MSITSRHSVARRLQSSGRPLAWLLGAFLLAAGCSDGSPTAPAGSLQILVFTGGEYPDVDGYTLQVSGDPARQVESDATVLLPSVDAGTYAVAISGIGANCTLRGAASRNVDVVAGESTTIRFEIDCLKQPDECTFGLDLATSGGLTPEITWNPMCRIVDLTVADLDWPGDEVIRWRVNGAPFLGPLQYGTAAPGADVTAGPLPLTPGHHILVQVQFFTYYGVLITNFESFTP
jgi:hypothetical protein